MLDQSGYCTFRIDPLLSSEIRRNVDQLLTGFTQAIKTEFHPGNLADQNRITVDFISENSLHLLKADSSFKICLLDRNQGLFSFGQSMDDSIVDVVLDESVDIHQLERLLEPMIEKMLLKEETNYYQLGAKNLKKFESKTRTMIQKTLDDESLLTSATLLTYTQALVDLEKELIHSDDLPRMEKAIKQFAKVHIEKVKLQFFNVSNLWKLSPSLNFLALPRYKGDFLGLDLNWDDDDAFRMVKKFFFVHTLVNFFSSQQEIEDPFFDEKLWEGALDSVPFPVALMSLDGQVYQHNTLFSKLNLSPADCMEYKVREKTLINDIPYNVYRKEIHHLDEMKVLFVFFTESFFLKGDGNLTPSGQELGIISSSIAHELNNPIAGIQAALSLLMLNEETPDEAKQTLKEMKSGATRCKQLIETFLGFSRANPTSLVPTELLSPIEVCYQQAQNLLRFRTVESGIRFSLEFSRHSEFRANVNLSLMTMTFYLILGELMTLYSHQLLVADKNQIEKVIKGELIESSQEIQIQLHELNISTLGFSKLIQNLLTIENFVLQTSDYSLRFIYTRELKDA